MRLRAPRPDEMKELYEGPHEPTMGMQEDDVPEKIQRKAMFEGQPKAFVIFEGVCPDCFGDLIDHSQSEAKDQFGNVSWMEFKCVDCQKVHFVEQTEGGDWATN